MRPADTSPEAWAVYLDLLRRMTPEERLQRVFQWSAVVRSFLEAGLREKFPEASEREIFLRSARARLGPELFRKAYGNELPDDRPTS